MTFIVQCTILAPVSRRGWKVRRIIKKYSNRRLYDTIGRRMITLGELLEMVRAGDDVEVIDNVSGEDITVETLSKAIASRAVRTDGLSRTGLHEMIRWGGMDMLELLKRAVLVGIGAADLARERVEKFADELVKRGEMSESERAKFIREMTEKIIEKAEKIEEKKAARREATISELKAEVERLKARIEELEKGKAGRKSASKEAE